MPAAPGHAHHVAEAGEDHAVLVRDRDSVVDAAHRDHADRAAGPVDELDVLGQQVVDAVLVDRVGVAAADLHQLVVAAGLDGRDDLAGEHPSELGVAVLVDEPHSGLAQSRNRGRRGRAARRPAATGADEVGHHLDVVPPARRADRDRACDRLAARASGTPSSEQVTQWRVVAAHWITLAFRSSSSCSNASPIRWSSPSVACASSSSTFERAKPTWISTQSPGRGVVEQPDVDVAQHAGDVDLRQAVVLVDDLDHLSGHLRGTSVPTPVGFRSTPALFPPRLNDDGKLPQALLRKLKEPRQAATSL